jgi:hypothetical protein
VRNNMEIMYPPKFNSPNTLINGAITSIDSVVVVADVSMLPDAPNIATIGIDFDCETIIYTGKDGQSLTGVTRGVQGAAKDWPSGSIIYRAFTAMDLSAVQGNITELNGDTLRKTNNVEFIPTGDYQPATKKYVDDNAGGNGNDANAVHVDTAGEINGVQAKSAVHPSDIMLIEDSAAGWQKKKVSVSTVQVGDIDGGTPTSIYAQDQIVSGGSP